MSEETVEGFRALDAWRKHRRRKAKSRNLSLIDRLKDQGIRVETLDETGGHYRVYNEDGDHGDMWITTETAEYHGRYQRGSGPRWLLNRLGIDLEQ